MIRYVILIEPTETGFSAYSPDLPGCVSTGRTAAEVEATTRVRGSATWPDGTPRHICYRMSRSNRGLPLSIANSGSIRSQPGDT